MRWQPIASLTLLDAGQRKRSWRPLLGFRRWAVLIVRDCPPNVDLSRTPGARAPAPDLNPRWRTREDNTP